MSLMPLPQVIWLALGASFFTLAAWLHGKYRALCLELDRETDLTLPATATSVRRRLLVSRRAVLALVVSSSAAIGISLIRMDRDSPPALLVLLPALIGAPLGLPALGWLLSTLLKRGPATMVKGLTLKGRLTGRRLATLFLLGVVVAWSVGTVGVLATGPVGRRFLQQLTGRGAQT